MIGNEMRPAPADATPARRLWVLPVGASRWSWLTLGNTWASWALTVVLFSTIYAVGTKVISEFGLSPLAWSGVVMVYLGVRALADLPVTLLSDRFGRGWRRKYVWSAVMLEYAVAGTLIAVPGVSSSLLGFVLLLVGVALGTTASEAIGIVATSEWWPKEHRGFAIGLHHTGYPVGSLIGGWFVAWILSTFGPDSWRLAYFGALAILPFILWYWSISTKKHYDEARVDTERSGLTWPVGEEGESRATLRESLVVFRSGTLWVVMGCTFAFQAMYNVFATSYPIYLNRVGGFSYAEVASLSVVWAITGGFFQFLLPAISDRIGRKWLIVGAGLLQAVVFLVLPHYTSVVGVVLVQLIYGITVNAVFPILFATATDTAGRHSGVALGATLSALWLGAVFGTFFGGVVLQDSGGFDSLVGYSILYGSMVGVSVLIAIARALGRETIPRRERHRPRTPAKTSA